MADVPKEIATILFEGTDVDGDVTSRWLDAPPTFADTAGYSSIQLIGLRPIIRKATCQLRRAHGGQCGAPATAGRISGLWLCRDCDAHIQGQLVRVSRETDDDAPAQTEDH